MFMSVCSYLISERVIKFYNPCCEYYVYVFWRPSLDHRTFLIF
jgi:hypothetical protein